LFSHKSRLSQIYIKSTAFLGSSQSPDNRDQYKPPPAEASSIELLIQKVSPTHGHDGIGSNSESQVHIFI